MTTLVLVEDSDDNLMMYVCCDGKLIIFSLVPFSSVSSKAATYKVLGLVSI
jgi:hypothetical protein